jgi:hypothetical protein
MNRNTFNPSSTFNYLGEQNIYEELARLKNATLQMPTYRTVFNDIADEWNKCTAEEQAFINNDEDYVKSNLKYQQAFNSFLLEMVGQQFVMSPYGKTAEEVLLTMKRAKERYRQNTDNTVRSVQEQNEILRSEIAELKKILGDLS